ncbi:hypothetical protein KI387_021458, partial [Taxus chinensis]
VHNKKRILHIAKEIASLATNLPLEWESSIHVRVDPVRMDLLKALMVGPKGTPYQNGVFIFDIYLPPDYPQVPPKVKFLTTGKGKVQFNPNLYVNGKVCLSLLGTWDGPSWQPWKSTLLQVLVSLQSLIFVADPFYNEPGYEMMHKKFANHAEKENRGHRYNTLKIAVLDTLRNPDSSFKGVIGKHFLHKKDEITEQCMEWIAASGGSKQHLYNKLVSTANEGCPLAQVLFVLVVDVSGYLIAHQAAQGLIHGIVLPDHASQLINGHFTDDSFLNIVESEQNVSSVLQCLDTFFLDFCSSIQMAISLGYRQSCFPLPDWLKVYP